MSELELPLDPDQRRAQESVRALRTPEPSLEFRAALRAQFISGHFETAPRVLELPWHRRPMTHWTLAVAASVVLVAAVFINNEGPRWRVVSAHGEGIAVVDGRPVPIGHMSDLGAVFHDGAHVVMPEGSDVELEAAGSIRAEIASGSDVVVPSVPGRWFAREARGEVRSGEIRLTTGAGFHGASLALVTPEAEVRVTGTTLAVICEPTGTCVCVLEGVVRVGPAGGIMEEVTGGSRGYVYADGRPMAHDSMREAEEPALSALRQRGLERTTRGR